MAALGAIVAGAVGLLVARVRTGRSIRRRSDALLQATGRAGRGLSDERSELPPPVRRYFDAVLSPERSPPRSARLHQAGTFLLGDDWRPMTATQHVTVDPPGFLWDATIRAPLGVPIRVVDAYEDGTGSLTALALGVLPVANASASPEMDHGELLRYLAEAPWLPTVLLPSNGVDWEHLDDQRARATIVDGSTSASLVFHFDEDDLIDRVTAERRYRQAEGDFLPWTGRFTDYEWYDGVRIPTTAHVAWETSSGPAPYWRASITDPSYDPVDRSTRATK